VRFAIAAYIGPKDLRFIEDQHRRCVKAFSKLLARFAVGKFVHVCLGTREASLRATNNQHIVGQTTYVD
jgi:hypothetical protein